MPYSSAAAAPLQQQKWPHINKLHAIRVQARGAMHTSAALPIAAAAAAAVVAVVAADLMFLLLVEKEEQQEEDEEVKCLAGPDYTPY